MKQIVCLLMLLTVMLATGCPENAPKLDLNNDNHKNLLVAQLKEKLFKKEWVEYNCAKYGFYNYGLTSNYGFSKADCGSDIPKKDEAFAKDVRNRILSNGVGVIDSAYDVYIRNVRKHRTISEFLADLLQTGGSLAAGITKGERPLQIIGVALTGFGSVRKSASINFYDDKTTNVLIKRMDASRSQVFGELKQEQIKTTDDYSFDEALIDLVRYFDAGTLNRAFTELDKQTSIEAEIARQGVLNIKGLQDIRAIPTKEELKTAQDVGNKLTALEADLGNKNKVGETSTFLMNVYDKIAANAEFAPIIKNLKDPAFMAADDTRSDNVKKVIKEAFKKLDDKTALTGKEYFALVNAIFGETEQIPKLQPVILNIFNGK